MPMSLLSLGFVAFLNMELHTKKKAIKRVINRCILGFKSIVKVQTFSNAI